MIHCLIELEKLIAEGLTNSLQKCLADVGFPEDYLRRNWLAFASDLWQCNAWHQIWYGN